MSKTIMNKYLVSLFIIISTLILTTATHSEEKELSGAKLWSQNCGRCHNYRGIHEFNDSQWDIIVTHMRGIANLPGPQARAILKFLQESNNPPLRPIKITEELKDEYIISRLVNDADSDKGMELYNLSCVSCHGIKGKGDGPAAVSLRPKPRDLSDSSYMSNLGDEHLYKVIQGGGASVDKSPFMPAWGNTYSDEDIANIISYLRTLSK
ncbi:MAG: c-type cytochrome [Candidatus Dadabacteria bacterium]|nr:c-type cytochrome [Candidatus Dadabacteria bacterium]